MTDMLSRESWESHRRTMQADGVPLNKLSASEYLAGFRAGFAYVDRGVAFFKTHKSLQSKNVSLQAEVAELRRRIQDLEWDLKLSNSDVQKLLELTEPEDS